MKPTSLVTGAAGFIGSHVVDELLARQHDVLALDDLSGGFRENVNPRAEFMPGSVTDAEFVRSVFRSHRVDYVFHLAAYAAEGLSHFIKTFNYTNNLLGSVNLINAAVNSGTVRCFVFTSSIAVYGRNQVPMQESLTPQPEDPYGIAKYAVELDLQESQRMFGLNHVIFRPHNVFGERQNVGDPYRNVIGIFMNQILQGKPMTVFGDGGQKRAFTHVSAVAPVIAESVHRQSAYNRTFNVGSDRVCTVLELARLVARAMGVAPAIVHLDPREEVVNAFASHDELKKEFAHLENGVDLDEGLTRMAKWVRCHGPRRGKAFRGVEVRRGLPAAWCELSE